MMISVITVCFNSEKTIEKTFESVLNQSYSDYEYIVVDGASTDGTVSLIQKYKKKFGDRMRYISEPDQGIYDAMNKGIAMCSGELIGILNSDDWYEPNTLELVSKNATGAEYEVVYGMQRTIKNGQEFNVVIWNHHFLEEQMITHPTCFVSRKTYQDFGVFSLEYRSSADYELMLRFHKDKRIVFTPIYSVLTNFVLGGISSSYTGVMETARLKYANGLIGCKKYWVTIVKAKLAALTGYS